MKNAIVVLTIALTAAALTPAQRSATRADDFEMARWTIDGGGAMHSTGDGFELSGTIGQPDAGSVMIGDDFTLTGGFWFRLVPGDCNDDGGVNLFDCGDFEACMAGPSIGPGDAPCPCFDLDADNDVDLADFAEFQRGFGR